MLTVLAAALSLTAQTAEFTHDPDLLSQYMVQACQVQQVGRNGATEAENLPFCTCLDGELASNASDELYRIFALGSQGAIGEDAQIDAAMAQAESQRIFLEMPAEEQAGVQPVLQSAVLACRDEAPVTTSAQ
ncbi:hypothetical protein HXX25_08235 [Hyphobacterium sp. CCMP332]|jgi:hypothetical protein|uniref:hypothetical protein n=1 Tax=Hyphobacterium sp. CCMP332 TaxID=2749086 RepID=UPI00165078E7|nr:hypothetical protein [Hyphobacterium sp. CCMP332]QNL19301.1 hypothetical protein HXX25_08235 [Hyphobacterium sp. CCMP332]